MPYKSIDLRKVKTYPLSQRRNLVTLDDLILPEQEPPLFIHADLGQIVTAIINARQNNKPVIWMMGAHVIKSGLGPLIIDLIQKGFITHIAGNGAVAIHDFELALIGETSEDVATSIEDGTFGMAEETGALIHQALREGARDGLGYGESLGRFIAENAFPHRDISVLYNAWIAGIPMTLHVTIGTDIIHQHPDCDFGILGAASGEDFKIFCQSVSQLDTGVFLNFGSAVTGPEVFLKAVSITRNLGDTVQGFTTANFDLFPLEGNYHLPISQEHPEYYYRPRKNIINRPTTLNGQGYHIQGNHRDTIPNLHHEILENSEFSRQDHPIQEHPASELSLAYYLKLVKQRSPLSAQAVEELSNRNPTLSVALPALCQAYLLLASCFERGGRLYISGNGGSMSDALHITGELVKSFAQKRPLSETARRRLGRVSPDQYLTTNLEPALPAIALGINPSLTSAIDNDFEARWLNVAQELFALGRPGDVFLGISTSGKARNILYAAETAKANGLHSILLTGEKETELSTFVDIAIHSPGSRTDLIQEAHIALYHCLCDMLERDFFR